jgi:putative membrane protein
VYFYIKALHIIFIVTWFSGLFYVVRLYIYNTEAGTKGEYERVILRNQFNIMIRRLWLGITWPSAILTLFFGTWMYFLYGALQTWLVVKLCFVAGLYIYHYSLHIIYKQQQEGIFKYTSTQLRIWNEVATVFLMAIVTLAAVKSGTSAIWGIGGLLLLILILMTAIRVYKRIRERKAAAAERNKVPKMFD